MICQKTKQGSQLPGIINSLAVHILGNCQRNILADGFTRSQIRGPLRELHLLNQASQPMIITIVNLITAARRY
jgi:hypothetical protein